MKSFGQGKQCLYNWLILEVPYSQTDQHIPTFPLEEIDIKFTFKESNEYRVFQNFKHWRLSNYPLIQSCKKSNTYQQFSCDFHNERTAPARRGLQCTGCGTDTAPGVATRMEPRHGRIVGQNYSIHIIIYIYIYIYVCNYIKCMYNSIYIYIYIYISWYVEHIIHSISYNVCISTILHLHNNYE